METPSVKIDNSQEPTSPSTVWWRQTDVQAIAAVLPPLAVRLTSESTSEAATRLGLIGLVLVTAYLWHALFGKRLVSPPKADQAYFALVFAALLPAPVGWFGVLLVASFGWVIGREILAGQTLLPPALLALAFALFAFPDGGYEIVQIDEAAMDPVLAAACVPGLALLTWRRLLPWQVVAGALIGTAAVAQIMVAPDTPVWWHHYLLGTYSLGLIYLCAGSHALPRLVSARWIFGLAVGGMIVFIRLADESRPDGVVFAILITSLFAPLLERALAWRREHG